MKKFLLTYLLSLIIVFGYATKYESCNISSCTSYFGYIGTPVKFGQIFTVGSSATNESFVLDSVLLFDTYADNDYYVEIYNISGGMPTGSAISTTVSRSYYNRHYVMSPVALQPSTSYAMVIYKTTSVNGYQGICLSNANPYSGGIFIVDEGEGAGWHEYGSIYDMQFELYGKHAPIITSQPTSITRCAGTSATFSVVVDSDAPAYQWRKGGSNISGATSSSYTISSVVSGSAGNYDCVVTESLLGTTTTSNTVTLTVPTTTSISGHPTSISRCVGTSATFSVTAAGTGLTYQWKKNGSNISGQTGTSYTISSVATGDAANYTVTVTGTCGTTTSSTAVLTVNTLPSISVHPSSQTKDLGESVTFSVTASGSGLTYQWRKDGSNISGATSSSYQIPTIIETDEAGYSVYINGTCGSTTSNIATLTINEIPEEDPYMARKKILLAGKFRNIVLSDIERDFGKAIPTTPTYLIDLAHDQNFLSYSGAESEDYIGVIRINANWDTVGTITYAITEDTSGLFTLVGDTIAFASVTGLQKSKSYRIRYRITDGEYYDESYGYVYIADEDSCYFIDPEGSGDVTSWTAYHNNFTDGYYYLQKRGTTVLTTSSVNMISKDNVTIGAYGKGRYPIVYMNSTINNQVNTFYIYYCKGTTIRDIQIQNYAYDAFKIDLFKNTTEFTIVDNNIITKQRRISLRNGQNTKVINNQIFHVLSDGIYSQEVVNAEYAYNYINDINRGYNDDGVLAQGGGVFDGDCIQLESYSSPSAYVSNDNCWIHHNYLNKRTQVDTTQYKGVIIWGSWDGTGDVLVEDNRIYGDPYFSDPENFISALFVTTHNGSVVSDTIIMRRNKIQDCRVVLYTYGSNRIEMSYNECKNNVCFLLLNLGNDSVILVNNTLYNTPQGYPVIYEEWSSTVKSRAVNNIFYPLTSGVDIKYPTTMPFNSSYNIYYNVLGVTLGTGDQGVNPLFVSPTDLRLQPGSPAINAGISIGASYDIDGNIVDDPPEIGAHEYIP